MIPVVMMNSEGELSYQVFNDNLAPVEQINRKLLAAVICASQKLTNVKTKFEQVQGKGAYTDAKIASINEAATTLVDGINSAIKTFEDAIKE